MEGFSRPQASAGEQADQRVMGDLLQRTRGPQPMCSLEQTGRLLCSVEVRFGANHRGQDTWWRHLCFWKAGFQMPKKTTCVDQACSLAGRSTMRGDRNPVQDDLGLDGPRQTF